MGMSPEEYWDGDAQACVAYRKAWEETLKLQDLMTWRQGAYIYHALCCVAPYFNSIKPRKPEKYIEPFGFGEKKPEEKKDPQAEAIAYMKAWAEQFNAQRAKKDGSRSECN